jgi:hypothetical protein
MSYDTKDLLAIIIFISKVSNLRDGGKLDPIGFRHTLSPPPFSLSAAGLQPVESKTTRKYSPLRPYS